MRERLSASPSFGPSIPTIYHVDLLILKLNLIGAKNHDLTLTERRIEVRVYGTVFKLSPVLIKPSVYFPFSCYNSIKGTSSAYLQ